MHEQALPNLHVLKWSSVWSKVVVDGSGARNIFIAFDGPDGLLFYELVGSHLRNTPVTLASVYSYLMSLSFDNGQTSLWLVDNEEYQSYPPFQQAVREKLDLIFRLLDGPIGERISVGLISFLPSLSGLSCCFHTSLHTLISSVVAEQTGIATPGVIAEHVGDLKEGIAIAAPHLQRLTQAPVDSYGIVRLSKDGTLSVRRLKEALAHSDPEETKFKPSTSIIFGGTRGLGAAIAASFAEDGLTPVYVAGRKVTQKATDGESFLCDVLSYADVSRVIDDLQPGVNNPLNLIFSAGAFAVGRVVGSRNYEMEKVLETKITGAIHLMQACEISSWRDTLILISSISAMKQGLAKGMAYYAAAHAFLDALAEMAGAKGYPVTSLALPLVSGVGHASGFEHLGIMPHCDLTAVTTALRKVLRTRVSGLIELAVPGHRAVLDKPVQIWAPVDTPADTTIQERLFDILREAVGFPTITLDNHIADFALDSLEILELALKLENEFCVELATELRETNLSVRELLALLGRGEPLVQSAQTAFELAPEQLRFLTGPDNSATSRLVAIFEVASSALDLKRKLTRLVSKHPFLQMQIVKKESFLFQRIDEAMAARELVLEPEDDPCDDIYDRIFGCLVGDSSSFGLTFCLGENQAGHTTLGLSVPHVFVDGFGLMLLVKEILRDAQDSGKGTTGLRSDNSLSLLRPLDPGILEGFSGSEELVKRKNLPHAGSLCNHCLPIPSNQLLSSVELIEELEKILRECLMSFVPSVSFLFSRVEHRRTATNRRAVANVAGIEATGGNGTNRTGTGELVLFSHLGSFDRYIDRGIAAGTIRIGVAAPATALTLTTWFVNGNLCFALSTADEPLGIEASQKLATQLRVAWHRRFAVKKHVAVPEFYDWLTERASAALTSPALNTQNGVYSYSELLSLADRVAESLGTVTTDAPVIVRGERGIATSAAILACIKRGKAIFPIDLAWPEKHWAPSAQKLGCRVVIDASEEKIERFADESPYHLVRVGDNSVTVKLAQTGFAAREPGISNLAYCILTSGTTAEPKAVAISYEALKSFLIWCQEEFSFTERDKFLQTASIAYGASIRQTLSPILCAGAAISVPGNTVNDVPGLVRRVLEAKASVINTVPAVLERFLYQCRTQGIRELADVRLVLVGGDLLTCRLASEWLEWFGQEPQLINMYGSTETVVNAAFLRLNREHLRESRLAPIGVARPGYTMEIWRAGRRVNLPDATGEIVVSGTALSDGYLDSNGQTVPLEPAPNSQGRLYHTGDLGYRNKDGLFVCLGRSNSVVNLNGVRIGLSEVEEAIGAFPERNFVSAVTLERIGDASGRLIALLESDDSIPVESLIAHLSERLPKTFIPERFIGVNRLPRTASGKIVRRDLIKLVGDCDNSDERSQFPLAERSTEQLEQSETAGVGAVPYVRDILREQWRIALKDEPQSTSNFFESGGDSLSAVRFLLALDKKLGLRLPSTLLFFFPQYGRLVTSIENIARNTGAVQIAAPKTLHESKKKPPLQCKSSRLEAAGFLPQGHVWRTELPLKFKWTDELVHNLHKAANLAIDGRNMAFSEVYYERDEFLSMWPSLSENRPANILLEVYAVHIKDSAPDVLWIVADHSVGDIYQLLSRLADMILNLIPEVPPVIDENEKSEIERALELSPPCDWSEVDKAGGALKDLSATQGSFDLSFALDETRFDYWHCEAGRQGVSPGFYTIYKFGQSLCRRLGLDEILCAQAIAPWFLGKSEASKGLGTRVLPFVIRAAEDDDKDRPFKWLRTAVLSANTITEKLGQALAAKRLDLFLSIADLRSYSDGPLGQLFELSELRIESDFSVFGLPGAVTILILKEKVLVRVRGSKASALVEGVKQCIKKDFQISGPMHMSVSTPATTDTALIAYLPDHSNQKWLQMPQGLLKGLASLSRPTLLESRFTNMGRSSLVTLPCTFSALYSMEEKRALLILGEALDCCTAAGARTVTFAGLLSSYLKQDRSRLKALQTQFPDVSISDGHAATVAAMVFLVRRVVHEFHKEKSFNLGIAGLGSIGSSVLRLLLRESVNFNKLFLFDADEVLAYLPKSILEVEGRRDYQVINAGLIGHNTKYLQQVDVLIAAVSRPPGVGVEVLKPGAIVIDDSYPPFFSTPNAIGRMRESKDVLILGGGGFRIPAASRQFAAEVSGGALINAGTGCLSAEFFPGCQMEGLLIHQNLLESGFAASPTVERIAKVAWLLENGSLEIPPFHLFNWAIPENLLYKMYEIHA